MNNDDFEQRLQRQPLRPIPTVWRSEILSHANAAPHESRITNHSILSTLNQQLSTILWPCPKAWAGLAAVWLLIFAVNLAAADKTETIAKKTPPPSPEMILVLREQQRLLAELIGSKETQVTDKPKPPLPQPRSERPDEFMTV